MEEDVLRDASTIVKTMDDFRLGLARYFKRILAGSGISRSQYSLMTVLGEVGEATMSQLAEKIGLTMGAGTNLVDKLIHAGLVERERSTEDRRIVKVRLTAQGSEVLRSILETCNSDTARFFQTVRPEERTAFIDILRGMVTGINAHLESG